MAQDYHIYIHDTNSGSGNKTTPFSAKTNESSFATKINTGIKKVQGVLNGSVVNTGVAALSKAIPIIATALIIGKITDKVLTTGFAHQEEYTGNYENNVNYNNFKAAISNAFHPIRTVLARVHMEKQVEKNNKEIAQQNRLIGNSIMKDFNIGV